MKKINIIITNKHLNIFGTFFFFFGLFGQLDDNPCLLNKKNPKISNLKALRYEKAKMK